MISIIEIITSILSILILIIALLENIIHLGIIIEFFYLTKQYNLCTIIRDMLKFVIKCIFRRGGRNIENIRINAEIEKLYFCLNMDKKIVGIKFLFSEEDFNSFNVEPAKNKLSYCMMVKIASSGKCVKARAEHFKCNSSARALGIKKTDSYIQSGREYYSYGLYNSLGTAKNVHDKVTYINDHIYGVILQPLEKFEVEPDVVIMISNPYNIMRVSQGYSYTYGMAKNIRFAGNQGVCSELTARPYENNDINVSLLCANTRFSCKWRDSEMGVGMPYKIFLNVLEGILKTLNPTEPDNKKEEIIKRTRERGVEINIIKGQNYYDSSIGVAKLDE
ncbi:DUF169 domain-containing protein [Tepidibacter aestuarii]|uniref:DUF169 domain-containing protein n=1 Tax=Tepidibacter aestuarii TaxID=2925782 RepID=UPI0020C16494|nr:DUF169 domain-containing protein [Tepidibacter aestuarii]